MYMCVCVYIDIYVIMKTMCPPGYHVPKCMSCHKALW